MAKMPRGLLDWSATARSDSCRSSRKRPAYSNKTSPAGVSRTVFPTRENNFSPYSCSSWRIWALTADWDRKTFRPAKEKLLCFATSTKVLIWSKSMCVSILAERDANFISQGAYGCRIAPDREVKRGLERFPKRYLDRPPTADTVEDTLARDIFRRHVILGAKDASRAGCNLDGLMGHIWKNDVEVAPRTQPAATSEDLVDIVRHVANTLAASGEKLAAGHIFITGSIVPPLPMQAGDRMVFQLGPIDTISVQLESG